MTKTTNWGAFDARSTKAKSFKSRKTEYTVSASQAQIDSNNDAIARYLAQRAEEKAAEEAGQNG